MKISYKLRNLILLIVLVHFSFLLLAQSRSDFSFTEIKKIPATPVKNQNRTITCWSFSGISFFESELLRLNKGEFDLSEMFIVRECYAEKALKFARMQGKINFGNGGVFSDVKMVWNKFGIVPDEVYSGLNYGEPMHDHAELDNVLKAYMDEINKNPNKKLSTAWFGGLEGILDSYLGKYPAEFNFKGKLYTPLSFAKELGIEMDNYVMLTSFTHHPFYTAFILEVPDNWGWGEVYNLKLEEMIEVIDNSINEGYTVGWAADISEKGFDWKQGIAIVLKEDIEKLGGTETANWDQLNPKEKKDLFNNFFTPNNEKKISQEMRQNAFDNLTTTDDHGMHITGIAKDQNGNKFYIVKNSWGTEGSPFNGYLYASEEFIKFKTTDILVHKNAIPKEIRKKLGL